jgi:glycerophosphoryl diester phosphodiesterase
MEGQFLGWLERICDRVMDSRSFKSVENKPAPLTIAHRGAWSEATRENTIEAFRKAKVAGMSGIEFDIQFTRDGVPVVHHDPHLLRFHGSSLTVASLTFAELKTRAPEIPTLKEVLAISHGMHLMIEIKTPLSPQQRDCLKEHLAALEPVRDFHLLVLDENFVRVTKEFPARCWILIGQIQLRTLVEISIVNGYAGVAGHYLGMTNGLVEHLHAHGQKAGAGFIPSANLLNRERARGIDWVFTNSAENLSHE